MQETRTLRYWLSPGIEFNYHDIWLGAFWEWKDGIETRFSKVRYLHIYVCILPCFPLHFKLMEYTNYGPKGIDTVSDVGGTDSTAATSEAV